MKSTKLVFLGVIFLTLGISQNIKAQTIELLTGNTLNGAMNGVLLGGATMAIQNSNNLDPVRTGVGLGLLYGVGVGIYDVTTVSIGSQFYISGTFNDGTNSTIIVLLDTFYGAVAGAVISTSVSLINDKPVLEGLQYGSAAGAWVGFGFGLLDSFMFARRHHISQTAATMPGQTNGLIRYSNRDKNVNLGLISPSVTMHKEISGDHLGIRHTVGVEVLNLTLKL